MGGVAEASTEYWYFHSFTGNKWRGCVWWMVVHKARGFSVKFRSAGSGSLAVNFVIGFFFVSLVRCSSTGPRFLGCQEPDKSTWVWQMG